jgi:hypothetical protein
VREGALAMLRHGGGVLAVAAIEAGELLHVRGGGVPRPHEQGGLVLGRGDARHGADLGEGQLAFLERRADQRQAGQGARDAELLARRVQRKPAAPLQPVGRGRPALPAVQLVEHPQHGDQPIRGGVDVAGERGDLALEQRRAALAGDALAIEVLECAGGHWPGLLMHV